MKTSFLIIFLFITTLLLSSDLEDTLKEIKSIKKEIIRNGKIVEKQINILKKENPAFAPKGLFESDEEYLVRQTDASEIVNNLRKEMIDDLWLKLSSLRAKLYNTENLEIKFISYEPNSEMLQFQIKHTKWEKEKFILKEKVNRKVAKELYKNWNNIRKSGVLIIDPDDKVRLVQIKLKDPITNWEIFKEFYKIDSIKEDYRLTAVQFSLDGKFLLFGDENGRLTYFNLLNGKMLYHKSFKSRIDEILISNDNKYVFSSTQNGMIYMSEFYSKKSVKSWDFRHQIKTFTIDSGKYLVVALENLPIRIIDTNTNVVVKELSIGKINKIILNESEDLLIISSENSFIRILDFDTLKPKSQFRMRGKINDISFTSDGRFLASGTSSYIEIFDISRGKSIKQINVNDCRRIKYLRFNEFLAYTDFNKNLIILNSRSGKVYRKFSEKMDIIDFDFNPDANFLAMINKKGLLTYYRTMLEKSSEVIADKEIRRPPNLDVKVSFEEPSGNNVLDALETGKIILTLTNTGKGPAKGIDINILPERIKGLNYNDFFVDQVNPNEKKIVEIPVESYVDVKSGKNNLKFIFDELNGFSPQPIEIEFSTSEYIKPDLVIFDYAIFDDNDNGQIESGEIVELTVRIKNNANSPALDVYTKFYSGKHVFFTEKYSSIVKIGNLIPNETADIKIEFFVNDKVENEIPLFLDITEKTGLAGKRGLKIPLTRLEDNMRVTKSIFEEKPHTAIDVIDNGLSIDVEKNIPIGKKQKKRVGIVIGIQNYRNISEVEYAHRDAFVMAEYFKKSLGIQDKYFYLTVNEKATKGEFDKLFSNGGWLDKRIQSGAKEVFIYYSGHGAPEPQEQTSYLIPYDGDPMYPIQTGISIQKLLTFFEQYDDINFFIFLDACFTGNDRSKNNLIKSARPLFVQVKENAVPKNVSLFSASGAKETAIAYPEKKHGLFTYFIMKGMQNVADISKDNILTTQELKDYLLLNVYEQSLLLNSSQNPSIIIADPTYKLIKYKNE